jgi:hypothetical protein
VDVTAWLLRLTPPRPLVVTGRGGTEVRLAAERAIRERGWRPAASPAEANILLATGDGLDGHAEQVWHSMPAPRTRLTIAAASEVPQQLDAAAAELRNTGRQRAHATPRHQAPEHHMSDMDMPGGIPMADRAEDRDGLMLDVLHVPLGPVLPLWPAGLIVHTRLQGDVIQEASVEIVGSANGSFWSAADRPMARRLDSSARLLALAGWTDAAAMAQRLRDEALEGAPPAAALRKWAGRVRRSRTLRWLLADVGTTQDAPPSLAGDALTRLHTWLDPTEPESPLETEWIVESLPALLAGAELATARLIVASLDPDLDLLAHNGTTAPNPHTGPERQSAHSHHRTHHD